MQNYLIDFFKQASLLVKFEIIRIKKKYSPLRLVSDYQILLPNNNREM